ncbi:MAG: copper homeostasis protein CutC, partial [Bacteroidales bacterium]|nr:copper homeostasis protein CutC [Bacteroidales bacterium]
LEDVIALGCDRLLTSGHAPDAFTGRAMIGELVRRAGGRIVVMAGCGVRPGNIAQIAQDSGAPEFHSSCISENWL